MSYSLGQAKWVPGQISFASLPQGRAGLPSVQPLLEAGLPIAPYVEHGSFATGQPAIMRYGLDPYRGIMGTDASGVGQDAGVAVPVKMNFELVLEGEPRGEYLYEELAEAADALAMAFSRSGKAGKVVSPPGSDNVVADIAPGRGNVRMLHGLGQSLRRRGARGVGSLLTEYACSETALNTAWTDRQRSAVNASRVAAIIAGAAVGGIAAAVTEENVPLGAIGGGITSFLINALWMGPHTV